MGSTPSLRCLDKLMATDIATRRLTLRRFRREDLRPALELLQASEGDSCFPRFRQGQVVSESRLESFYLPEEPAQIASFSILLTADQDLLGCASIDIKRCEFEYWMGSRHWRQGYAKEALSALLPLWSQAGVGPRFVACTARSNTASSALLLSLGLRYIGHTIALDSPVLLRYARLFSV